MQLDVTFLETTEKLPVEFGNVTNVSDGGYERGYNEGYEKGKAERGDNPLYYAANLDTTYRDTVFPENHNITIYLAKPVESYQTFSNAKNLKSVKIITDDKESLFKLNQTFRGGQIETIDLTECSRNLTGIDYLLFQSIGVKKIMGALDLSNCTSFTYSFFTADLEEVEIVPNTIKANIRFNSTKLTAASKQSIINGLATTDRLLQLDLDTSVINSLSDEQQAEIFLKNWEVI